MVGTKPSNYVELSVYLVVRNIFFIVPKENYQERLDVDLFAF